MVSATEILASGTSWQIPIPELDKLVPVEGAIKAQNMSQTFDLDWILQRVVEQRYRYSRHGDQERQNDALSLLEVEQALLSGRILETYPDTGRGESCLLAGFSDDGKPIHIVCGRMDDWLVVVTVYIPTPPKSKNPFERG